MKGKTIIFILSAIVLAEIICIAGLCVCKGQSENESDIVIRDIPSRTVLYSIYRGNYFEINEAIKQLYNLAQERGMSPYGPFSTCYLNSPLSVTTDHRLIEIQIPVDPLAMEQAGTLGNMTDIKRLPAMKVAVAVKPEGLYDPTMVIANLFSWINKKGYIIMGKMQQTVLNDGKGEYQQLRTEFTIPIDASQDKNRLTLPLDPCYL